MNFTRENLLTAIEKIDLEPEIKSNRSSSTYDLVYNNKKYPPILILSVANQLNGKEELFLKDFNNNIDEPFKILTNQGFEIIKKNKNIKSEFEKWLILKLQENSGAISSYLRSLDLLSELFKTNGKIATDSIFEIEDFNLVDNLYKETLLLQKDKNSYLHLIETPSYGDKGFFSASLKKYKEFLLSKTVNIISKNQSFKYKSFHQKTQEAGLIFSEKMIARFVASLCTKPFVICSGLSGSGKTKLAQAFVQWVCESDEQYKIIPVGADWTNREPLLGYPNGLNPEEYITPDSRILHLLIDASKEENQSKPYFLILDEMNLSHVERYFADFLSIMESNDSIKLYTGSARKSLDGIDIKQEIHWPKNLFIIGTVNIDETTYMFSPKVLDRANVIEFRITEEEIAGFLENPQTPDLSKLEKGGINMAESFLNISASKDIYKNDVLTKKLNLFFSELKEVGAEFGYRTASEIMQLITKLKALDPTKTDDECLDIAIMQKLLPKLHGSRSKLVKVLIALAALCIDENQKEDFIKNFDTHFKNKFVDVNIIFDISFEKLIRMYRNVLANGFTSYAEA